MMWNNSPKVIIDSGKELIVRRWIAGKGKGSYPTALFEVIINAEYSIDHLETLVDIFNREIKNARECRKDLRHSLLDRKSLQGEKE